MRGEQDDGFPATCRLTKEESSAISYLDVDLAKEGGEEQHFVQVKYRGGNQIFIFAAKTAIAHRLSSVIRSVNQAHALGNRWSSHESLGALIKRVKKGGDLIADDLVRRAVGGAHQRNT